MTARTENPHVFIRFDPHNFDVLAAWGPYPDYDTAVKAHGAGMPRPIDSGVAVPLLPPLDTKEND